jgi:DNA helicase-2/ATP-dependent DNA helicase PcrA
VGDVIRHERFGIGKVIALEDNTDNAKATVDFEKFGRKQLLLKFAKYEIVE